MSLDPAAGTSTSRTEPVRVIPKPDSRLAALAAAYDDAKAAADAATRRLKAITDAIKVELATTVPGAPRVDLEYDALAAPLRLQAKTSWRLDTGRLKQEDPLTYVRYAVQSTAWELRALPRSGSG